jgi:PhzF family phenazine biosynthesis protein
MAATIPIFQVDAFTAEPFRGNPAAVCLLTAEATPAWMQAVAAEMNLSETAFLVRRENGDYSLRWFTPAIEVPLCGHATLASAHVLWEERLVSLHDAITFQSKSGPLIARREGDWICLDFPAQPVEPADRPGLSGALGCKPVGVYWNRVNKVLAELDSEQTVRNLEPDTAALVRAGIDACIVTARARSGECEFVSRFFAPGVGIDEDPVTGSAHCSLAPFWAERLGKTDLIGHQVSKRGGVVRVRPHGDRVDLLGQAITIFRGQLLR